MIITVLNYNTYQNLDNYKSHNKSQTEATQKPHRSHTINKYGKNDKNKKKEKGRFTPPSLLELKEYSSSIDFGLDCQGFLDFYTSKGWMIGSNKMKDWKAAVRTWKKRENVPAKKDTGAWERNLYK